MFVGRVKEMKILNDSWEKPGFSMTVITGRRRVGKSTLIREFINGKKAVFYTATRVGDDRNIELLTDQVIEALDPSVKGARFSTIEELLDFLTGRLEDDKLTLVLDELPYWAESNESLLSILQKYIDTKWHEKNLFLILCGSSLSFMEDKILSEKSPLFGRRDSQIHLQPFNYLEAAEFVPDYSYEDKAICYGVTGGIAKYLSLFDPQKSLDENIKKLFFSTGGYLYDEPHNLLTQEFSDVVIVNNVIEQIAAGENTLTLISDKIHENPSTVVYSINRLIRVGIVEKKLCVGEEKNKKKVQYVLKDTMFQFWFEFIPKAVSVVEMDQGDIYYERVVKPRLHDYMGSIFENMCRWFTLRNGTTGKWDFFLTKVGSWWGTESFTDENGKKQIQQADVDIVGVSDVDHILVTGECKFKNKPMDPGVYETLVRRSKAVPIRYRNAKYLLFSLSGFKGFDRNFFTQDVMFFTLMDLYSG